jgi:hypothetical protein
MVEACIELFKSVLAGASFVVCQPFDTVLTQLLRVSGSDRAGRIEGLGEATHGANDAPGVSRL